MTPPSASSHHHRAPSQTTSTSRGRTLQVHHATPTDFTTSMDDAATRARQISLTSTAGRSLRTLSTVALDSNHRLSMVSPPPPPSAILVQHAPVAPSAACATVLRHLCRCLAPAPLTVAVPDVVYEQGESSPLPCHPAPDGLDTACMPPRSVSVRVDGWCAPHGSATFYQLVTTATTDSGTFTVSSLHRYSEFRALHARLRHAMSLPRTFPVQKRLFHTSRVKQRRQVALQEYLTRLCTSVCATRRTNGPADGAADVAKVASHHSDSGRAGEGRRTDDAMSRAIALLYLFLDENLDIPFTRAMAHKAGVVANGLSRSVNELE